MNYSAYVKRAKALAHEAHAGQTDKSGDPYINHVSRVAAAVSDDPLAECLAWLHDVMEDRPGVYDDRIFIEFPLRVYGGCLRLDRGTQRTPEDYYRVIRTCDITLRVKLADIADNSDPARLAKLDDKTADRLRKKYAKAMRLLGAE